MNPIASILVVDDLAANRTTIRELLDSPDYRIIEAADGLSALKLASEAPPDLVLLDVMMPGMDGYEVCRRLRADARLAEVPVIIVTALDDQTSRLTGIEAGADDFVTMPLNRAELRARVRTITRLNRYRRMAEIEAELRQSESRFLQLAENSTEVFWFAALKPFRMTFMSPVVEQVWGRSAAEFYENARLWHKAIHPDDRPRVEAAFDAVLKGLADRFAEEYRVVRPDGLVRWVRNNGTPMRDTGGAIVTMGGVAHDITERKDAEERMLRAQRLENLGMLAAGIAHDFNNALAPIVMSGPLLRQHVDGPGANRLLDILEKSAERGASLVRQLLSFARGASGGYMVVQPRHLLQELADLAEVTFPKSIRFEISMAADLWPIHANATQVHQVFLNLCVNARDGMPKGGDLTLTAANCTLDMAAAAGIPNAQPGDYVTIEVRDTGTGIAPDVVTRIWDPFYSTKGEGKGTGLGLSTVLGIVSQHHGFITLETRVGHGTTFTVYLPAAAGARGGTTGLPVAKPARGQGELILVVDDEEQVCLLAAQILDSHGYRTLSACDGAEAIAVYAPRAGEVRLVLTDLQMPMLDGATLAAALRRLQPDLPIIAMSGAGSRSNTGYREFATAFIAKPFRVETLLMIVRSSLDATCTAGISTPANPTATAKP